VGVVDDIKQSSVPQNLSDTVQDNEKSVSIASFHIVILKIGPFEFKGVTLTTQ
jgi:hypothetical protein